MVWLSKIKIVKLLLAEKETVSCLQDSKLARGKLIKEQNKLEEETISQLRNKLEELESYAYKVFIFHCHCHCQ